MSILVEFMSFDYYVKLGEKMPKFSVGALLLVDAFSFRFT